MTIVTDTAPPQPSADSDSTPDDVPGRDDIPNEWAEAVRLLAQAYFAAPLFA